MRIAHVTDIHVQQAPQLGELFNKRALGAANLYLNGRRKHFTRAVQQALVDSVLDQQPDVLVCTGDITALATQGEFETAKELLGPMFQAQPSVLIPGNHDTYVPTAARERWLEKWFGEWTGHGDWPRLHQQGDVAFVCVDACRALPILSSGHVDAPQLERLDRMLAGVDARFVFVLLHYPLRDRRGDPYGPNTRNLANASDVEAVLLRHGASVGAILHGHEHHGFRTVLGDIPILNPGASGYAWLPEHHRTAHYCVYTVTDGALTDIQRFRFDGDAEDFVPEPGGAWATKG